MPRRIARKLSLWADRQRSRWYMRVLGERLQDRAIWSPNRRSVTAGLAAGIAIAFVPLPLHTIAAALIAVSRRINLAAILLGTLVVNPLTIVPLYYLAYRIGAWLLRQPPTGFHFHMSWQWLESGLGPLWRPFLLGCLVCALVGGFGGRLLLEWIWRTAVLRRFRLRHGRGTSG